MDESQLGSIWYHRRMRLLTRWLVLHGLVRFATRRWAAAGDPQAALIADPTVRANPIPAYEGIRAQGRLVRTRIGYITADYEVAHAVLRSDDFSVTSITTNVPPWMRRVERVTRGVAMHPLEEPSLLSIEPPDHTRYRALVSSVFTARAVTRLSDQVAGTAETLLDELATATVDGATSDIIDAYCARLPVAVISDLLGVRPADRRLVLDLGELVAPSLDVGLPYRRFRDTEMGLRRFHVWLGGHLAELRRNPGDDLISQLIQASLDGRHLTDRELRAIAGLVLVAGFETTVNLLGNGVRLLLDHPDQLDVLEANPGMWPNAVDEILRLEAPVQLTARVCRRATELAGQPIHAGQPVTTILAAANRDPGVFADPHTFDVTRSNAGRHLAFSSGRHYCVGAALARAEGEIGLQRLFTRFPGLVSAGIPVRRPTRVLRGWISMPVRLSPSSPDPVVRGKLSPRLP
jgi:cytochrome P450